MSIVFGSETPLVFIYGLRCLCHPELGVRYVGQTIQGEKKRLGDHRKGAKKPQWPVNYWVKKHGPENIVMTILEVVDNPVDLNDAEVRWIKHFGTFCDWKLGGVNMTPGGFSAGYSDEAREAIRKANSGEHSWTKLTWETVRSARADYEAENVTFAELGRRYGISTTSMMDCIKGATWIDPSYQYSGKVNKYVAPKHESYPNLRRSNWKVTKEMADEIRVLYATGEYYGKELAERFSLASQTIYEILGNRIWPDPAYLNTKIKDHGLPQRQREKISASNKGKHKPDGFGQKVSDAISGANHGMSKLTEDQAKEILRRARNKESYKILGEEFGVSRNQISRIKNGERWGYLQDGV